MPRVRFLPKITLSSPFGGVEFELPPTDAQELPGTWSVDERFRRVCELTDRARAALEAHDLAGAIDRLLAVADEFPAADRRDAILLSHRFAALGRPSGLVTEELQVKRRNDLVEDILDAVAKYRSEADLATQRGSPGRRSPPLQDRVNMQAASGRNTPSGAVLTADDASDSAIRANGVGWRVGSRWILRDVSFEVPHGSIVGVVGRNGAGKTTLLRLLAHMLAPSAGAVSYPQLAARGLESRRALDRIAFVPQEPTPYSGEMETSLRWFAALRGIRHDALEHEIDFTVERFRLGAYRNTRWSALSAGFRTRVELARSMLASPDILILDEPLGPLDSLSQREYLRYLQDVAASRRAVCVILTSQDIEAVSDVADYLIVLTDGRVTFAGAPGEIEQSLPARAFEFAGVLGRSELEAALAAFPGSRLIDRGATHVLLTSPAVAARAVLEALISNGETIRYFRDLSRSPHQLIEAFDRDADTG